MEKSLDSISPALKDEDGTAIKLTYFLENNPPSLPEAARVDIELFYGPGQISNSMGIDEVMKVAYLDADKVLDRVVSLRDKDVSPET